MYKRICANTNVFNFISRVLWMSKGSYLRLTDRNEAYSNEAHNEKNQRRAPWAICLRCPKGDAQFQNVLRDFKNDSKR